MDSTLKVESICAPGGCAMPSVNVPTHTHIVRVRAEPQGLDPYTARQRLQRSLGGLTLQPTNVPPHSLVYIRHLRSAVPLLQHIPTTQHASHLSHSSSWQRNLQAQINACAASAARPALGLVPANANAVLFSDEAEQLACLTRDWLHGAARQQWWWAALLARGGVDEVVRSAWLAAPVQSPAALAHLARDAQAEPFLQRLPGDVILDLLQRVITVFGLRHLAPVLAHPHFAANAPNHPSLLPAAEMQPGQASNPLNPWQAWLPHTALQALPPAAVCLLGIGLGLQRQAARVQSAEFAQRVAGWLAATPVAQAMPRANPSNPPNPAHAPSAPAATSASRANPPTAQTQPLVHAAPPMPPLSVDADAQSASTFPTAHSQPATVTPTDLAPSAGPPAPQVSAISTLAHPSPDLGQHAPQQSDGVLSIHTQFGGTFYLINVMLHLGWYADFTQPLQPGLDQNIYDLLAQIGEQTFGECFRTDVIWDVLAQLAGQAAAPEDSGTRRLAEHMRTLQQRLAQALGETGADDEITFVCAHPARIVITTTRIDVFLSLEQLPIAIRLSGLDRDPGWVPAAGRYFAFHFD